MAEKLTDSPARKALLDEVAKRVRTAITKRDEMLATHLAEFDQALEHGDDEAIEKAGIMLVAFSSSLVDPVTSEIRKWGELDKMLARAEGATTDA